MTDGEGISGYVAGSYCSFRQILALAVPAVLLNAAAPATSTIQTVLLGRLADSGRDQLAAFSAVGVVANFTTFLLNFMVRAWQSVALIGHSALMSFSAKERTHCQNWHAAFASTDCRQGLRGGLCYRWMV